MRLLTVALILGFLAAGAATESVNAQAQHYPTKPIHLVIPFPPGGGFDKIGRPFSEALGKILGQPVVIDYKAGAGGNIGAAYAARSAPDGYTLFIGNVFLATSPAVHKSLPYNPIKDFAPISKLGVVSTAIAVNPSVPAKNLKQLITLSKKKPIYFGTPGVGSMPHLVGELLNLKGVMKLVHVPYRGSSPAIRDAIAGQVQMVITPLPNLVPFIRAGKLRGIAVLSPKRAAIMPNLPTFYDVGISGVESETWYGLFTRAGTPAAVIKILNDASVQALKEPDLIKRLSRLGIEPESSTPQALAASLKADTQRWKRVVAAAKIPKK